MKLGFITHLDNAAAYQAEARRIRMQTASDNFKAHILATQEAQAQKAYLDAVETHKAKQAAAAEKQTVAAKRIAEAAAHKMKRDEDRKSSGPPKQEPLKKQKRKYKNLVWRLTDAQDLSAVPGIELREWRKYDLDHIISIHEGFKRGLPPQVIASLDNLRIIPHKENSEKGSKSDYDAHPLIGLLIAR